MDEKFSMNIWILDADSGVTLLYYSHLGIVVNEDLVSGLLTALNQFSKVELKQSIDAIDMAGLRWVYLEDKLTNILFIGADTRETTSDMVHSRLMVIKQSFLQGYIPTDPNWRDTWNGNIDRFRAFGEVIDEYYKQWIQAENITNIAEFFDILGIFQQLFNLLQSVVEEQGTDLEKMKVYDRLEYMFKEYKEYQFVKVNPELSKIEFSIQSGVNIISINPTNCDFIVVEKQLINIITNIVSILKQEIRPTSKLLDFFLKGTIFDYIFNSFNLLQELHLDKFLLQLFLLR